jgi:hypothetical protein
MGIEGAGITPELEPRLPCELSIRSIDVVVVGVVGAPEENRMLYGCLSFYSEFEGVTFQAIKT